MPAEESTSLGWGDLMEEDESGPDLPPMKETVKDGIKTLIEYKYNEEGKKIKITRTYKLETRRVAKCIAKRKLWKKFGEAKRDNPHGPDPATTFVGEDVFFNFSTKKDGEAPNQDEDPIMKLKNQQKIVKCRICKGDHWTTKCPYKDSLVPQGKDEKEGPVKPEQPAGARPTAAQITGGTTGGAQSTGGKYVPPSLRDGAGNQRRGETMSSNRRTDEAATVRVTNLSEDTRESDLQELFRPFGPIARIYLAKDKVTNQSKGFAFISYVRREDAARAIASLQGFGYDHLILSVEWAKPSGNN